MARLVPALGAVLLVLVVTAAPAGAATRVVPLGTPEALSGTAGPVLVPGAVVWGERTPDGGFQLFRLSDGAATPSPAGVVPPAVGIALGASESRIVVARALDGRTSDVLAGPLGGALERVDSCGPAPPCQRICGAQTAPVAAVGDAVAWASACTSNGGAVTVRDLATGASFGFEGEAVDLAGRFATNGNVVYDRGTGAEVYRLEEPFNRPRGFSIQEDGKVAFREPADPFRIGWASPERTRPLWIVPPDDEFSQELRLGNDLIAVSSAAVSRNPGFQVLGLNGGRVRRSRFVHGRAGGWDFDGRTLAYSSRPCAVTNVVLWDVAEAESPLLEPACPAPRISAKAVRAARDGSFSVGLVCDGDPTLGCPGTLRLTAVAPRSRRNRKERRLDLGAANYSILGGGAAAGFRLTPAARRFVRRYPRVRIDAVATARRPSHYPSRTSRARFRITVAR